ncbi:endonuclease/exonuclease/phosphatase family metal-dependent hydrolase [Janthinobacterium lividum]|uniref:endonuclease/exonuclease/phosphatase family protein n=1 Tax=Janthinobacterium lividum TaxID=29581 RepID=UPI003D236D8A
MPIMKLEEIRILESSEIKIAWWNVGNFYHFLKEKIGNSKSRWPQSREAYDVKLGLVEAAIKELCSLTGRPDIFFFCEITADALSDLRERVFPDYKLISLDVKKDMPTLQVGVLFNPDIKDVTFAEQPPILVPATPIGTRPMIVLDASLKGEVIRIVGCHWQSRFDPVGSERVRWRLADHLSKYTYDFLNENLSCHHVVVIGDLNEEPFDSNLATLYAHRHRARSKAKPHRADRDIQRAHLYNTSWRLMGEKFPHPRKGNALGFENCAGTFYWESEKTWHHFDHIIVSGGLLNNDVPYLDEDELHVICSPIFLTGGLPKKFIEKNGAFIGLSDHLPVVGKIFI